MRVTLLGTGPSSGVPGIGMGWGDCDPKEARNRRKRSGVFLESNNTKLLFDTSPDLRDHLLTHEIDHFDAVLYTHAHADHAHGIDELRWICQHMQQDIPAFGTKETLQELEIKFPYCFGALDPKANGYYYKPVIQPKPITEDYQSFSFKNLTIIPFEQNHGFSKSTGYRINDFALSTDVLDLDEQAFHILEGVKVWVIGCLQPTPHPTHIHIDIALKWFERIKPEKMIFTHMNTKMDYQKLLKILPKNITPGYDGYSFEII